MSWAQSLIKLSSYEVEVLQKRLADIAQRKAVAEMRLLMLQAEGEGEMVRAREDAQAGWYQIGFMEGLRMRKAVVRKEIDEIGLEEEGARDALAQAFEEQKKYEQIAENARLLQAREAASRPAG